LTARLPVAVGSRAISVGSAWQSAPESSRLDEVPD